MTGAQEHKSIPQAMKIGAPKAAPALKLLKGNPPTTFEYTISRPTLVHFWATWCAPCVEELPALVNASDLFKKHGVDVLLISVDAAGVSKVPPFLSRHKITNTVIYWDPRSELMKKFGISILPTTVAINSKGQEIGRATGAVNWANQSDVILLATQAMR